MAASQRQLINYCILLIIFCLIEYPAQEYCNCRNNYIGPRIGAYCMNTDNVMIADDTICKLITDFSQTNYPYTAVEDVFQCDSSDSLFKVYLEARNSSGTRKVAYRAPFLRHQVEGSLFAVCLRSPKFSSGDYTITTRTTIVGQTQEHLENYCNATLNIAKLLPALIKPFTVSTICLDYEAKSKKANVKNVSSRMLISIVNYPNNSSDWTHYREGGCELTCALTAKSVNREAGFRTKFSIEHIGRVIRIHETVHGDRYKITLHEADAGKYLCSVDVQFRPCLPFSVMNDSVVYEAEMEDDTCKPNTSVGANNDRSFLRTIVVVTIVTTTLIMAGLAIIVYHKIHPTVAAEKSSPIPSSNVPSAILEKTKVLFKSIPASKSKKSKLSPAVFYEHVVKTSSTSKSLPTKTPASITVSRSSATEKHNKSEKSLN